MECNEFVHMVKLFGSLVNSGSGKQHKDSLFVCLFVVNSNVYVWLLRKKRMNFDLSGLFHFMSWLHSIFTSCQNFPAIKKTSFIKSLTKVLAFGSAGVVLLN